ncbi:MAG: class I SAM-dependent methyltransferase [Smithellaceae bacterium]
MENEIIENHQRYSERVALYQKYGYDIEEERSFVIEKACPFSGNILEAGTGKGYFSVVLARLGFHFTSFDISAEEQQYARLNLAYHGLASSVRFDVADLECLPYPDASFDVIFAVNIIHHLSSVRSACDELVRILSPMGKIVLSDFNTRGFALVDKVHVLEGRQHEVGAGTMIETKDILTEYGLTVDEHQGANQDVLVACRT